MSESELKVPEVDSSEIAKPSTKKKEVEVVNLYPLAPEPIDLVKRRMKIINRVKKLRKKSERIAYLSQQKNELTLYQQENQLAFKVYFEKRDLTAPEDVQDHIEEIDLLNRFLEIEIDKLLNKDIGSSEEPSPDSSCLISGDSATSTPNASSPLATKEYLSVKEVAEYLGLSINTIYQWVSRKKIPFSRVGSLPRFKRSEIDDWVKAKKPVPRKNRNKTANTSSQDEKGVNVKTESTSTQPNRDIEEGVRSTKKEERISRILWKDTQEMLGQVIKMLLINQYITYEPLSLENCINMHFSDPYHNLFFPKSGPEEAENEKGINQKIQWNRNSDTIAFLFSLLIKKEKIIGHSRIPDLISQHFQSGKGKNFDSKNLASIYSRVKKTSPKHDEARFLETKINELFPDLKT